MKKPIDIDILLKQAEEKENMKLKKLKAQKSTERKKRPKKKPQQPSPSFVSASPKPKGSSLMKGDSPAAAAEKWSTFHEIMQPKQDELPLNEQDPFTKILARDSHFVYKASKSFAPPPGNYRPEKVSM